MFHYQELYRRRSVIESLGKKYGAEVVLDHARQYGPC